MTNDFIYAFIKRHLLGVISTVTVDSVPEAAVIGIAITEDLEIVFDTVKTSRKYKNILQNNRVALVIGWDGEETVQYEGMSEELSGKDAAKYKEVYFAAYPDGRKRAKEWPDIVHFRISPKWIRYSNFAEPGTIEEVSF